MFDSIVFHDVPGSDRRHRVLVLALSTCGFCRRGQDFLEKHQVAYQYIHLDSLDPEVKAQVKAEYKEKFGVSVSYPALVVDGTQQTIGYIKSTWESLLGLSNEDEAESVVLE